MNPLKVCHLLSGGLDSSVLLHWLASKKYEILPIFVNYGQISAPGELKCAQYQCHQLGLSLKIIDISKISELTNNQLTNPQNSNTMFYPNRNLLLLSIAGIHAYEERCNAISIGIIKSGTFGDSTKEFVEKSQELLSISLGKQIAVITPFINFDKKEVAYIGKQLNVSMMFHTYSCIINSDKGCTNCEKCNEKFKALEALT